MQCGRALTAAAPPKRRPMMRDAGAPLWTSFSGASFLGPPLSSGVQASANLQTGLAAIPARGRVGVPPRGGPGVEARPWTEGTGAGGLQAGANGRRALNLAGALRRYGPGIAAGQGVIATLMTGSALRGQVVPGSARGVTQTRVRHQSRGTRRAAAARLFGGEAAVPRRWNACVQTNPLPRGRGLAADLCSGEAALVSGARPVPVAGQHPRWSSNLPLLGKQAALRLSAGTGLQSTARRGPPPHSRARARAALQHMAN